MKCVFKMYKIYLKTVSDTILNVVKACAEQFKFRMNYFIMKTFLHKYLFLFLSSTFSLMSFFILK